MEFHGLSELESFQMTLMWVGLTLRHRLSSNALLTIMWHSMGVQAANQRVLPFSRRIKPTISMWTSLAGPLSVRATSSKTNTPFIRKLATRWYWTIPMYTSLRLARRAKKTSTSIHWASTQQGEQISRLLAASTSLTTFGTGMRTTNLTCRSMHLRPSSTLNQMKKMIV